MASLTRTSSWSMGRTQNVELLVDSQEGLQAVVTKEGRRTVIPKESIRGVPLEVKEDPTRLHSFLLERSLSLNSDGDHLEVCVSTDEEVAVDIEIIREKFRQADQLASQVRGQTLLPVIGNTNAGKSTFVNYMLLGKEEMKLQKIPGKAEKGIVTDRALTPIGHGQSSYTQFPVVPPQMCQDLMFCDCPGFLDNRGPEFDIPNAYAISKMMAQAGSVRGIIVLINYYSIDESRGAGLRQTEMNLKQFFGTNLDLQRYKSSILFLVTKSKIREKASDTLAHILRKYPKGSLLEEFKDRIVFYDPLDRKEEGATREEILARIQHLSSISQPGRVFCFSVGEDSQVALRKYLESQSDKMKDHYNQSRFSYMAELIKEKDNMKIIPLLLINEHFQRDVSFVQAGLEAIARDLKKFDVVVKQQGNGSYIIELFNEGQQGVEHTFSIPARLFKEKTSREIYIYFEQTLRVQQLAQIRSALEQIGLLESFNIARVDQMKKEHIDQLLVKIEGVKCLEDQKVEQRRIKEEQERHRIAHQQEMARKTEQHKKEQERLALEKQRKIEEDQREHERQMQEMENRRIQQQRAHEAAMVKARRQQEALRPRKPKQAEGYDHWEGDENCGRAWTIRPGVHKETSWSNQMGGKAFGGGFPMMGFGRRNPFF